MIQWQNKPSRLFKKVLRTAFEVITDFTRMSIPRPGEAYENCSLFEDDVVNMFGGLEGIIEQLEKLYKAFQSRKLYMITDCHFFLIDQVLRAYCDIYNDMMRDVSAENVEHAIIIRGKPVLKLNALDLISDFFYDMDYTIEGETYDEMSEFWKAQLGLSIEINSIVHRKVLPPDDLVIWEIDKRTRKQLRPL